MTQPPRREPEGVPPARPATLADVARRAGVSPTTVSFVLNDRPMAIAEGTRRRVLEAARALHYTGNAHVTALRNRRAQVLGVHLHDYQRGHFLEDPVMARIMTGIFEAARRRRYHLCLYTGAPVEEAASPGGDGAPLPEAPADAFLDRRVDGLLLVHAPVGSRLMEEMAEVHLPCVVVFNRHAPPSLGAVDADNLGGTRLAVAHLARLGHRRIAHLTRAIPSSNRDDRCAGFERAMGECGLGWEPGLQVALEAEEAPGERLQALLSGRARPTALFCYNDELAVRVVQEAAARGWRVPEDLSVVGFDDTPLATIVSPPLTTVRQPLEAMGRVAADALVDMIEAPEPRPRRWEAPVELVVRGSTAPPAGR